MSIAAVSIPDGTSIWDRLRDQPPRVGESFSNSENRFIKSNVRDAPASGWLERLVGHGYSSNS